MQTRCIDLPPYKATSEITVDSVWPHPKVSEVFLMRSGLLSGHLKYIMSTCTPELLADINHLKRIKRLVTGIRHLFYEEKLQRLDLRADLITAFKTSKGLLNVDPGLFFPPPNRRGLGGHPYMVLQGKSHRWRRESAFSVKYWNKVPASVFAAPSVNIFKKRLDNVWTELFTHFPV